MHYLQLSINAVTRSKVMTCSTPQPALLLRFAISMLPNKVVLGKASIKYAPAHLKNIHFAHAHLSIRDYSNYLCLAVSSKFLLQ